MDLRTLMACALPNRFESQPTSMMRHLSRFTTNFRRAAVVSDVELLLPKLVSETLLDSRCGASQQSRADVACRISIIYLLHHGAAVCAHACLQRLLLCRGRPMASTSFAGTLVLKSFFGRPQCSRQVDLSCGRPQNAEAHFSVLHQ